MSTPITPPLHPDDPRLTAYALGECDAAEATAISEALAADPALAAEVEAIRATAGELGQHFANPSPAGLDEVAHARIQQAAARPRRRMWLWSGPVLAAAALAIAVIWSPSDPIPMRHAIVDNRDAGAEYRRNQETDSTTTAPRPSALSPLQVDIETEMPEPVVVQLSDDMVVEDIRTEGAITPVTEAAGREEAVSASETSGSGAFMALSSGASAPPLPSPTTTPRRWDRDHDDGPHLPVQHPNTEDFQALGDNPFKSTAVPGGDASTFAIDVDSASYTLARRMLLQENRLPPRDAVRIEEFINYFPYAYAPPAASDGPFAVSAETVAAPWHPQHRLVRIGIQGKTVSHEQRAGANLVFLIDTSGSMGPNDRLRLAQRAFPHLVSALDERDTVSIVTYSGSAGVALHPTSGADKRPILNSIASLRASGGTAGGAGLAMAYRLASERFIEGGINRVILVTDGDFNVGVTDQGSLIDTVRHYASQGIKITVLGVGTGNLHDQRIEQISNRGNGVYRYLDSEREAERVFTDGLLGDLVTIASDVKTQVFFNPSQVAAWRLIGYQNRRLAREDFNNDKVDAGDIGAGHQVTALYEIIPAGQAIPGSKQSDPNPFVRSDAVPVSKDGPLLRLRLRHKLPGESESSLSEFDLHDQGRNWASASPDTQWAAAVAAFGMALRGEAELQDWDYQAIEQAAKASGLSKADPQRVEFMTLLQRAAALQRRTQPQTLPDRDPAANELKPLR